MSKRNFLSIVIYVSLAVIANCPVNSNLAWAAWDIQTIDSVGDVGKYTSIALDGNNNPCISYHDSTKGNLKFTRWNGSQWVKMDGTPGFDVVDSANNVGQYTSINLDGKGYSHISYWNYGNSDLKYAKWTGAFWNIQTVDSTNQVGKHTSLCLDKNDNPHISYFDITNGDLKYAKWTGSAWHKEKVDYSGKVGTYNSLVLDNNDYPHISYHDDTHSDLKYAYWNGISWITQTVDNMGTTGSESSIALDNSGFPHISYYEDDIWNLKYARWTGSTWAIETVDDNENVGKFTSIVLDKSDYPYISYYDETNGDLKFTRWNGSQWVKMDGTIGFDIVDSKGNIGEYTSMALGTNNNLHISYYDKTNGNLKYAKWIPTVYSLSTCQVVPLLRTFEVQIQNKLANQTNMDLNGLTISFSYGDYEGQHPIGTISGLNISANSSTVINCNWTLPSTQVNGRPFYGIEGKKIYVKVSGGGLTSPVITETTVNIYCTDFDWQRDAYSFDNYALTWEEFKSDAKYYADLFDPPMNSLLYPVILARCYSAYITSSGGLCYGFSATSILYRLYPNLKPSTALNTYKFEYNDKLALLEITEYQRLNQIPDTFEKIFYFGKYSASEEYDELLNLIKKNNEPALLSWMALGRSHVVVGYKIVDFGDVAYIYVYNPNHGYYISGETSGNTPIDDKPKLWPHDDNKTQNFVVYYKKTNQMIVPKSDLVPNIDHQYASYDYNKVFIDQAKPSSSIVLDDLKSMLALGFSVPFIVIDPLMEVVFTCPVEPLIKDENGKRIGIVNGSQVNEIPGAVINITNDLKVFYLPVGLNYKIEITGTGSGTMYASFFIPRGQDKVSQMIYKNVPITSTSKIYSSLNQSTTLHTMSIDTNGDGIIEQVIHPDVTSNRQQPLDMGDSLVSKIHNYPNPMKSAGTTFTYYLSKDAKVNLKIYDVSNDLVAQFDNLPGNANIWNEYPWNGCDKDGKQLSNGVYIYVVTADSGDNKESKINKLLILR